MPVQFLKGVGPARAHLFAELGVQTVAELLEYFPRDWVFAPEPVAIQDLRPGQTVTVIGLIEQTQDLSRRRPPRFKVLLSDETGSCHLLWFHGAYLRRQLEPGQVLAASGKVSLYKHQLQMTNPRFAVLEEDDQPEDVSLGGPVYPAAARLPSRRIRTIIRSILPAAAEQMEEFYPGALRRKNHLIERPEAYRQIHNPDDPDR